MQTIKIGPRNLTLAERKEMKNIAAESQAAPDGAYRYFVHNPLDKTTLYYRSEARCLAADSDREPLQGHAQRLGAGYPALLRSTRRAVAVLFPSGGGDLSAQ